MADPKKDEEQLGRIAKRLLATPPQPRDPKPKPRKVLRRQPKKTTKG